MNVISNRASALNTAVLTQMSAVINVAVAENFTINLTNTTRLSLINRNTNVTIEQIAWISNTIWFVVNFQYIKIIDIIYNLFTFFICIWFKLNNYNN